MSRGDLEEYDRLINMVDNDWDLYYWITEKELPPPPFHTEVSALCLPGTRKLRADNCAPTIECRQFAPES